MRWFEHSGVLLAEDGRKGICERIILTDESSDDEMGSQYAEHVRSDCALESALLFDLFYDLSRDEPWKRRALALYRYPLDHLLSTDVEDGNLGLFTWSNQHPRTYWVDDNSWSCMVYFKAYARTGNTNYLSHALLCAEGLLRNSEQLLGGTLRSHWGGLYAAAMATAYLYTKDQRYLEKCSEYTLFHLDQELSTAANKSPRSTHGLAESITGLFGVSLYYFATSNTKAKTLIDKIGEFLLLRCRDDGAMIQSWDWQDNVPLAQSKPVVDLVYGHNFAPLAFYHAYLATGEERYRDACIRSLQFLSKIQISSSHEAINGGWRGSFDPVAHKYGGPLHKGGEGGPNSMYTGWTHAPIGIGYVFCLTGDSLLPVRDQIPDSRVLKVESMKARRRWEHYSKDRSRYLENKKRILLRKGREAARSMGNVAFGRSYSTTPSRFQGQYNDDTGIRLTDGEATWYNYEEQRCVGFQAPEVAIEVDLGALFHLSAVYASCLGGGFAGCDYPNTIIAFGSRDGEKWTRLGETIKQNIRFHTVIHGQEYSGSWFGLHIPEQSAIRFLRLECDMRAKNLLLIDEIRAIAAP